MGDPTMRVFKNRTRYRKNLEFYKESEDDDPILMTMDGISRAIMPNIFNYCDKQIRRKPRPEFPAILFKLRAIQYLQNHNNKAMKFEIIDWYEHAFNYTYPNLRYIFREMIFDGLLNPEVDDEELIEYELAKRDYPVSASELSFIIYDRVLKNTIYYEIVGDDTPIHTDLAEIMEPMSIAELGIDSDREESIFWKYLKQKTLNVILFYFYLDKVEKTERKRFILQQGEQGQQEYEKQRLSIFNDKRKNGIVRGMNGYLTNFLRNEAHRRGGGLRNTFDDWYDFFQVPTEDRCYRWS